MRKRATGNNRRSATQLGLGASVVLAALIGCESGVEPGSSGGQEAPATGQAQFVTDADTLLRAPGVPLGPLGLRIPADVEPGTSLLFLVSEAASVSPSGTTLGPLHSVVIQSWVPSFTRGACDSLVVVPRDQPQLTLRTARACIDVRLNLDRPGVLLAPSDRVQIGATATVGGVPLPNQLAYLAWHTDDDSIASVDPGGRMVARRLGTTRLVLASGAAQASANVSVIDPEQLPGPAMAARVTSTPEETFVSWVPTTGDPPVAIIWTRAVGAPSWDRYDVIAGRRWRTLPGQPAGTRLQVVIALTDEARNVVASRVDTVTTGDGAACQSIAGRVGAYGYGLAHLFCNGSALVAWVGAQGLNTSAVRCGNRTLETLLVAGGGLPNCAWTAGNERLLLLRGLGDRYQAPVLLPTATLRTAFQRLVLRDSTPQATVWQSDPAIGRPVAETRVGLVQGYQRAVMWSTDVNSVGAITLFEPPQPNGAIAIWQEGHGGEPTEIGAETISWLLARGWSVVAVSMPRVPHEWIRDMNPDEEDGSVWRMLYGIGQVTEWIHRAWAPGRDPVVVALGRSGGAWTTLLYAALDPRIDATVVINGFEPLSQRLYHDAVDIGDWEQAAPSVFGVLDYDDIVRLAAQRDLLITYNEHDVCCFQKTTSDPFVQWLGSAEAGAGRITIVVSDAYEHGLSAEGYAALDSLLTELLTR
jgi:hypothetical protein